MLAGVRGFRGSSMEILTATYGFRSIRDHLRIMAQYSAGFGATGMVWQGFRVWDFAALFFAFEIRVYPGLP